MSDLNTAIAERIESVVETAIENLQAMGYPAKSVASSRGGRDILVEGNYANVRLDESFDPDEDDIDRADWRVEVGYLLSDGTKRFHAMELYEFKGDATPGSGGAVEGIIYFLSDARY